MGFSDKQAEFKKLMKTHWETWKEGKLTEDDLAEYYTCRTCFFNGMDISSDRLMYSRNRNRDFARVSEKSLDLLAGSFMMALERVVEEHFIDILGFLNNQPLEHLLEEMKLVSPNFSALGFEVQEPTVAQNKYLGFLIDPSESARDLSRGFSLYFFGNHASVDKRVVVEAISTVAASEPFCTYDTVEPILKQRQVMAMLYEQDHPVKACYRWQNGDAHQAYEELRKQEDQGKISNLDLKR